MFGDKKFPLWPKTLTVITNPHFLHPNSRKVERILYMSPLIKIYFLGRQSKELLDDEYINELREILVKFDLFVPHVG